MAMAVAVTETAATGVISRAIPLTLAAIDAIRHGGGGGAAIAAAVTAIVTIAVSAAFIIVACTCPCAALWIVHAVRTVWLCQRGSFWPASQALL